VMGLTSQGPVKELTRADFMTAVPQSANRYLDRPSPSSLAAVIDTILGSHLRADAVPTMSRDKCRLCRATIHCCSRHQST
jgi:hypothetical protein